MKRSIAGFAVAGALLLPLQFGSAAAASIGAAPVATSGSAGSSEIGCTSNTNPTCSPLVKALVDLLAGLSTGSSKGGGAPAA
ncbi:hypothetical protein OHB26_19285 [Nocardia sp. NBC_01503]|uniref:hypothetical protein n=1 Tax=Nocardia sp. NBC_01503 TaxID=2975997 RepID=UPI002E7BB3C9|nr:hypothetical protein [Nocardia sp. NBC_01503]WTL29169.1 hypothetical protein OHB26_19285 [Nocardia sp. NBC_01503]